MEGVGETHDTGRCRVGDVRVFDDDVERVGDMRRSGWREERLFCGGLASWDW